jgi:hypothetical protein
MFAPEIARAQFRGPRGMTAPRRSGLHYHPLRREELCSNASGAERNPDNDESHSLREQRNLRRRSIKAE